jgi:hypothetical protein
MPRRCALHETADGVLLIVVTALDPKDSRYEWPVSTALSTPPHLAMVETLVSERDSTIE